MVAVFRARDFEAKWRGTQASHKDTWLTEYQQVIWGEAPSHYGLKMNFRYPLWCVATWFWNTRSLWRLEN